MAFHYNCRVAVSNPSEPSSRLRDPDSLTGYYDLWAKKLPYKVVEGTHNLTDIGIHVERAVGML